MARGASSARSTRTSWSMRSSTASTGASPNVGRRRSRIERRRAHQKEMTLGAMAISIPLIAIAGGIAGLAGIAVVCVALAVIAVMASRESSTALSGRRRSARSRATTTTAPPTTRRPHAFGAAERERGEPTPHSDSVATSGETIETRPWKYASKRHRYERPKRMPAGASRRASPRSEAVASRAARRASPARSVAAAADSGSACPWRARTRTSRTAKSRLAPTANSEADRAQVRRPARLAREQDAASDDEHRADRRAGAGAARRGRRARARRPGAAPTPRRRTSATRPPRGSSG